jgi:16S rRNA (uracil1498-N3)-methyltransferase
VRYEARTRLFLPDAGKERLVIADYESLEVARALRLRPGNGVGAFADDSYDYYYRVEVADRRQIELRLVGREINRANPKVTCILVQACGKAGKNADIVRQATALGVTEISFFRADRSVGRMAADKVERLTKVAIESCRQCGRSRIPKVTMQDEGLGPVLDRVVSDYPGMTLFALCPDSDRHLNSFPLDHFARGSAIIVGPEGGFSCQEKPILLTKQARFAHLGPRILRMELASVVALALVQSMMSAKYGVRNAE